MIFHPKPGQKVRLHYKNALSPCHGCIGIVLFAAKGPGPRNVCVECADGQGLYWKECVPRGNINPQAPFEPNGDPASG